MSSLPKHGQSPQWRLERWTVCLQTDAVFCLRVSWSWLPAHVMLDKFFSSQGVSGFNPLQRLQHLAFDVMKKNTCRKNKNTHLYIQSLSARFHPFFLQFFPPPPSHLPSPLAGRGCGLQCCCITGGASCSLFIVGEGRELANATLHLSLSLIASMRPLTRKRSAPCAPPVLSSPKKGTRAHRARRQTIETIKTEPGCVNWRSLELHNR